MRVICILALVFVAVCDADVTYNDYGGERFLPGGDLPSNGHGIKHHVHGKLNILVHAGMDDGLRQRSKSDDDETFNDSGVERSLGGTPEDDETFNDYGVERSLGGTPDDDETFNDYGVERTFAPGDYGEDRRAELLGKKHHHHHHHHVTKCPVEKNSGQGEANRDDDGPVLWPHLTNLIWKSKGGRDEKKRSPSGPAYYRIFPPVTPGPTFGRFGWLSRIPKQDSERKPGDLVGGGDTDLIIDDLINGKGGHHHHHGPLLG